MFSWAMKKSLSHLSLYRIVIIIVVVIICFYTHMKAIVLTASHEAPPASVTWFSVSTAPSSGTIFTQFYLHKDDNQSFMSKHRAVLQKGEMWGHIYCTHVHRKKALVLTGELLKGAVCKIQLNFDPQLLNFGLTLTGHTIEWWDLCMHSLL